MNSIQTLDTLLRMGTVDEIKAAINNLSPEDFARVRDWFLELDSELWDRQIAEDSAAGRLDFLTQEIESDIAKRQRRS